MKDEYVLIFYYIQICYFPPTYDEWQTNWKTNDLFFQVGTFNLNKPQLPPDLAKDFNGKEVFQIHYGIHYDKMKSILYATNMDQLMLFGDSFHKSADHKSIAFSVGVSAIGVSGMFVAIGMDNGTLKVLSNDAENKVWTKLQVSSFDLSSS